MCGLPFATRITTCGRSRRPVTVLSDNDARRIVRVARSRRQPVRFAPSTFGHRIGWLAEHSHSGFNAPRHALLAHRSADRPPLYRESIGRSSTRAARCARWPTGRVDVIALDAWWWWLLQRHDSETAHGFRSIGRDCVGAASALDFRAKPFPESRSLLSAALTRLHEERWLRRTSQHSGSAASQPSCEATTRFSTPWTAPPAAGYRRPDRERSKLMPLPLMSGRRPVNLSIRRAGTTPLKATRKPNGGRSRRSRELRAGSGGLATPREEESSESGARSPIVAAPEPPASRRRGTEPRVVAEIERQRPGPRLS
jgi:hypothetical protein